MATKKKKEKTKETHSYDNMVYTKEKDPKPINAPKGYKPKVVKATKEIEKIMRETPLS